MSKIYGVTIIGCGHMGEAHMEEIHRLPEVHMRWACDLNLAKAESFCRYYHCDRATVSAEECIADPSVDIVIIATYPSSHLEYLRLCLQYGKHVLCEKPITGNAEDAAEFVRLVREHPECRVLVGHILRHNRSYNYIHDLIQSGTIGSPIILRMTQNHHTMDWPKYLALIRETSPIIDCGVHYMDVMQWFTGESVTWISGIASRTEPDVPEDRYNYGMITVRLSGGSVGYYEAGWSHTVAASNVKEFIGPKGRIRLTFRENRQRDAEEGDLIEIYHYPESVYETVNLLSDRRPTGDQLRHLIRMIEENIPANPTLEEVYNSFMLVLHADKAVRTGVPETFDKPFTV